MLPQEIIRAKRDGRALSRDEIETFIAGLTSGAVTEGQAAAFAMAVFFRGMNTDERVASDARDDELRRGAELGRPRPSRPRRRQALDRRRRRQCQPDAGARCSRRAGVYVPMISGRGLGHTGGTLDKLEAIPGYVAKPDKALFRKVVREVGCAIIGQTDDLAPADKRLYAIRDVTATVESIPLITASILSKKLAAGLQGLVMDVKTGNGAFMATPRGRDRSRAAASSRSPSAPACRRSRSSPT